MGTTTHRGPSPRFGQDVHTEALIGEGALMLECPVCMSDELELVERLPDDRRTIRCSSCHHTWTRGEAKRVSDTPASYSGLRDRFPDRSWVEPDRMARVEELKAEFLVDHQ